MHRRLPFWILAASAAVFAMGWAWMLRWTCDDAYISFRYAEHFVEGHGLVFNLDPTEAPVEGYSNFSWTMWLALGMALGFTGDAVEGWAAVAGTLCHGATVLVLAWAAFCAGRAGGAGRARWLPAAAVIYAVHHHAASLAPAGLETALFVLLMTVMAVGTIAVRCPWHGALLGWLGVLAAMTRPDGALPCMVTGAFLLVDALGTRRWRTFLAYALPFALAFLPYLLWRWSYYGYLVPNTFFAKSGGDPYPGQGLVYLREYAKVYWALVPAAALLLWSVLRRPAPTAAVDPWSGRRAGAVLSAHVAVYLAFVIWVGGDFMFARFLLPVTPLLLLGVDLAVLRWRPVVAAAITVLLAASVLLRREPEWLGEFHPERNPHGISDNRRISMKEIAPGVTLADASRFVGAYLRGVFDGLGVRLAVAGGQANLAYRTRVPVAIECATGLTDAYIAHLPIEGRGQTGHEKHFTRYPDYLQDRSVQIMLELSFATGSSADPYRDIVFPVIPARLVRYDRVLLGELKRRDPKIRFADFEAVLDGYLAGLGDKTRQQVAQDLAGFRDFYFDHNDDPARLRAFEEFLAK